MVLVMKPNWTLRMCIDFIDLSKAFLKNSYPLPKINKLEDAMAGHALLSFMDVFLGYHQIPLYPEDLEKIVFITALRAEECWGHLPAADEQALSTLHWADHGGIRR